MLGFVTRITGPGLALVERAIGGFGTGSEFKKCRKLLIPLILRMQAAIPRWVEMGKSLGRRSMVMGLRYAGGARSISNVSPRADR
jgi:hypothetical protein